MGGKLKIPPLFCLLRTSTIRAVHQESCTSSSSSTQTPSSCIRIFHGWKLPSQRRRVGRTASTSTAAAFAIVSQKP